MTDERRADAYAAWARSGEDWSFALVLPPLLELLPPPPARVLDVGCGEGRVGAELVRRGYGVVGVDASPRMVELAREHHDAVVADARSLPFDSESFDVVVTVNALMEIDELEAVVQEAARVLRVGGVLCAVVEHPAASGPRVARYSQPERHTWPVTWRGVHLGLGGVHRPLVEYSVALERAGFRIDALRETGREGFDPLQLAIRASRTRERAGAAAVIVDDEGRVLVVKENYGRRRWSLPGGVIEPGEAPQDAAVRETLEETGVVAAVDHLVGVYRLDNGFGLYVFRCEVAGGGPAAVQDPAELSEVRWARPDEVGEPRSNVLRHALPDALAGVRGAVREGLPRLG